MTDIDLPYGPSTEEYLSLVLSRLNIKFQSESETFNGIEIPEFVKHLIFHYPDFATGVVALAYEYKFGTPIFTKRWKQKLLRKKKVETRPKEPKPINKTPSHEVIISNFEECY